MINNKKNFTGTCVTTHFELIQNQNVYDVEKYYFIAEAQKNMVYGCSIKELIYLIVLTRRYKNI